MKQAGFTLLEAMVSLILIATVGMALLDWINTNFNVLQRVETIQERTEATRNALVFMETINPLERKQGSENIGIYQFNWSAEPVILPKSGVSPQGGYVSLYEIALYDTTVEVKFRETNTLITRFTLRQVGYKQTIFYEDDFF